MKNKKHITTIPSGAAASVNCSLNCGNVNFYGTDGKNIEIERTRRCHVKVSVNGNEINIKQHAKPFFRKTEINVYIPAGCIADINLKLKRGSVKIDGGEFGNLNADCGYAEISVTASKFTKAAINCNSLKFDCADMSVNGTLICSADDGEVIAENSHFTKTDMTFENGNMGITGFRCRESAFSVKEGSINVSLCGAEEEYSLNLLSPNGTCNRENVSGGAYALKAYTGSGNIVVDFVNTCAKPQADLARGA